MRANFLRLIDHSNSLVMGRENFGKSFETRLTGTTAVILPPVEKKELVIFWLRIHTVISFFKGDL